MNRYFIIGTMLWIGVAIILFLFRPKAKWHQQGIELNKKNQVVIFIVMLVTIILCVKPMGWNPIWNGTIPEHRNQYEIMAKSIAEGHLYLDYEVDPLLLEMENPYDYDARRELGVDFRWDHAFYEGQYYMYFGIVPVIILFLPYLLITGTSLTTFHATQIFVAAFICGVFSVFQLLIKRFSKEITLPMYLVLSVAFSVMSVWYSVGAPALYCTAITSALCMEIWSFYFFVKAVWIEKEQKKTIGFAFLGSLLGALAFGCRPPIALANIFVLPMLVEYLRNRKVDKKLIGQLGVAASPYLVVAVLLMLYNYARFDNPFEFGQAYQLTVTDQSEYTSFMQQFEWKTVIKGLKYNFFLINPLSTQFPFVVHNGIMINYPILMFSVIGLLFKRVRMQIKELRIGLLIFSLFLIPIVITFFDVLWAPYLMERYRMDIYWIIGILCYIVMGIFISTISEESRKKFSFAISLIGLATIAMSILLCLVPIDSNIAEYSPEMIGELKKIITLGFF